MMIKVISIVTCAWFLAMGVPKLLGLPLWAIQFENWGYPVALMYGVGAIETIAGLMLLFQRTAIIGAAALIAVMLGAAITHTFNFDGVHILKPALSAVVLVWIVVRRRSATPRKKQTQAEGP